MNNIDEAAAQFPGTFGLRAFPGQRFTINRAASFVTQDRVMLYVFTEGGEAFCKGTVEELKKEIVT